MPNHAIELIVAGHFGLALLHTFPTKQFERLSKRFPRHAGVFHLLGGVEVVFGFWAFVLVLAMAAIRGGDQALARRIAAVRRAAFRFRRDGGGLVPGSSCGPW